MGFNSIWYILLLPVTAGLYYLLPSRWRWLLLIIASYLFYGFYAPKFLLLISGVTLIAYFAGMVLHTQKSKIILTSSILLVLSFLLFFKYSIWITEIINDLGHLINVHLINDDWLVNNVILPIGISFYTFQAISYVVDVYKERVKPEFHLGYFALYLSFFPQLVAGPIEKPGFLIPQFRKKAKLKWHNFSEGSKLILLGFFKKIVIADNLFIYVNRVFDDVYSPEVSGFNLLLGLFAFIYYLYNDFSAYCDIAMGSARYFDIHLSQNFFKPFSSLNFRELWTRWHATLSIWVKTYVFTPMGGIVRGNKLRTLLNVTMVFIVLGIWHGASYNFLFFGLLAATYVVIDYVTKDKRLRLFKRIGFTKNKIIPKFIFKIVVVTGFMTLGVFFITRDIHESKMVVSKILNLSDGFKLNFNLIGLLIGVILVTEAVNYFSRNGFYHPFNEIKSVWVRIPFYAFIVILILYYSAGQSSNFYYLRF